MSIPILEYFYGQGSRNLLLKKPWSPRNTGEFPIEFSEGYVYIAEDTGEVEGEIFSEGDSIVYKDSQWVRLGSSGGDEILKFISVESDTIVSSDALGKILKVNSSVGGGNINLTVPNNLGSGFNFMIEQSGTDKVSWVGSDSVVINNVDGHSQTRGQYSKASLTTEDGINYLVSGDTEMGVAPPPVGSQLIIDDTTALTGWASNGFAGSSYPFQAGRLTPDAFLNGQQIGGIYTPTGTDEGNNEVTVAPLAGQSNDFGDSSKSYILNFDGTGYLFSWDGTKFVADSAALKQFIDDKSGTDTPIQFTAEVVTPVGSQLIVEDDGFEFLQFRESTNTGSMTPDFFLNGDKLIELASYNSEPGGAPDFDFYTVFESGDSYPKLLLSFDGNQFPSDDPDSIYNYLSTRAGQPILFDAEIFPSELIAGDLSGQIPTTVEAYGYALPLAIGSLTPDIEVEGSQLITLIVGLASNGDKSVSISFVSGGYTGPLIVKLDGVTYNLANNEEINTPASIAMFDVIKASYSASGSTPLPVSVVKGTPSVTSVLIRNENPVLPTGDSKLGGVITSTIFGEEGEQDIIIDPPGPEYGNIFTTPQTNEDNGRILKLTLERNTQNNTSIITLGVRINSGDDRTFEIIIFGETLTFDSPTEIDFNGFSYYEYESTFSGTLGDNLFNSFVNSVSQGFIPFSASNEFGGGPS